MLNARADMAEQHVTAGMAAFLCFSWRGDRREKHTTVVRAALMCFSA